MADFINTIDIKEDEDIFNELVTRTIVDFRDNVIQSIGNNAFAYCYDLEVIDLPNSTSIGTSAFASCAKLNNINIPLVRTIGSQAFFTAKISYINLPSVTTIAANAFKQCINLTKVDMNTCEMKQYAFTESAIDTVIVRGTTIAKLGTNNVFAKTPLESGNGFIYVPKNLVDSYKSATNWSVFADRIRAIEDYPDICG